MTGTSESTNDALFEQLGLCGGILEGQYRLDQGCADAAAGGLCRATDLLASSGQTASVLIKFFPPYPQPDTMPRAREWAQRLAMVDTPRVARVRHFGKAGSWTYLATEVVKGERLDLHLARVGRLAPARAQAMLRHLAEALAACRERGVVFQALAPCNVACDEKSETAALFNFDFPPFLVERPGPHPQYASPESLAGAAPDHRDDVYAFACIAYELLSGRLPFDGLTALSARREGHTPMPLPGLSGLQNRILLRGLAPSRTQRSPSAHHVVALFGEPELVESPARCSDSMAVTQPLRLDALAAAAPPVQEHVTNRVREPAADAAAPMASGLAPAALMPAASVPAASVPGPVPAGALGADSAPALPAASASASLPSTENRAAIHASGVDRRGACPPSGTWTTTENRAAIHASGVDRRGACPPSGTCATAEVGTAPLPALSVPSSPPAASAAPAETPGEPEPVAPSVSPPDVAPAPQAGTGQRKEQRVIAPAIASEHAEIPLSLRIPAGVSVKTASALLVRLRLRRRSGEPQREEDDGARGGEEAPFGSTDSVARDIALRADTYPDTPALPAISAAASTGAVGETPVPGEKKEPTEHLATKSAGISAETSAALGVEPSAVSTKRSPARSTETLAGVSAETSSAAGAGQSAVSARKSAARWAQTRAGVSAETSAANSTEASSAAFAAAAAEDDAAPVRVRPSVEVVPHSGSAFVKPLRFTLVWTVVGLVIGFGVMGLRELMIQMMPASTASHRVAEASRKPGDPARNHTQRRNRSEKGAVGPAESRQGKSVPDPAQNAGPPLDLAARESIPPAPLSRDSTQPHSANLPSRPSQSSSPVPVADATVRISETSPVAAGAVGSADNGLAAPPPGAGDTLLSPHAAPSAPLAAPAAAAQPAPPAAIAQSAPPAAVAQSAPPAAVARSAPPGAIAAIAQSAPPVALPQSAPLRAATPPQRVIANEAASNRQVLREQDGRHGPAAASPARTSQIVLAQNGRRDHHHTDVTTIRQGRGTESTTAMGRTRTTGDGGSAASRTNVAAKSSGMTKSGIAMKGNAVARASVAGKTNVVAKTLAATNANVAAKTTAAAKTNAAANVNFTTHMNVAKTGAVANGSPKDSPAAAVQAQGAASALDRLIAQTTKPDGLVSVDLDAARRATAMRIAAAGPERSNVDLDGARRATASRVEEVAAARPAQAAALQSTPAVTVQPADAAALQKSAAGRNEAPPSAHAAPVQTAQAVLPQGAPVQSAQIPAPPSPPHAAPAHTAQAALPQGAPVQSPQTPAPPSPHAAPVQAADVAAVQKPAALRPGTPQASRAETPAAESAGTAGAELSRMAPPKTDTNIDRPAAVLLPPAVLRQQAALPPQVEPGYWYYCRRPLGYYPYVRQCGLPWEKVTPRSIVNG